MRENFDKREERGNKEQAVDTVFKLCQWTAIYIRSPWPAAPITHCSFGSVWAKKVGQNGKIGWPDVEPLSFFGGTGISLCVVVHVPEGHLSWMA